MYDRINYLYIFCTLISILSEAESAGEYCRAPDNRSGICVPIQSCNSLYRLINKKVLFQADHDLLRQSLCGNQQSDVCCPEEASISTTQRSSTMRISAQKCNEYAEYAYNKTQSIGIYEPGPIIETSNCATLGVELIFGGEEARPREFPHMALIGFGRRNDPLWDCGGTLISEQFVLSAAHCSGETERGPARYIRLGEHDQREPNINRIEFDIIQIILHDNILPQTYNDIALFKLDRQVKFNYAIRPACLPQQSTVPRNVSASGWGSVGFAGTKSNVLLKVGLETFSESELNSNVGYTRFKRDTIVFAGHHTEKKDTCPGDSGGPLQVYDDAHNCTYIVVGVTSTGPVCGSIGSPAVYTAVYSHLDWIENTVWPNE